MKFDACILLVDDDEDILTAGKLLLKREYQQVIVTTDPGQLPAILAEHSPDVVLLDMNFGPGESSGAAGIKWLQEILSIDADAVVIMITAHGGVATAVEAMKNGATDFVAKPWQNEKLLATISAALKLSHSRKAAHRLANQNKALATSMTPLNTDILGTSAAIQAAMRLIKRAAPTDANVLITGENGTGKELAAQAIHKQSQRADAPFVSIDLGAVPENLFESELYGHRKGSFTGADEDRVGRLQAAHGGTLFLDEIGNIPLSLQAKLLTVLEQRQVTPIGTNKAQPIDVRVISATNLSVDQLRDPSVFRQDLLFRLNTVEITLPPLRERDTDALTIAQHFLGYYERKYQRPPRPILPEAELAIIADPWPGNVRALRHATERAVIMAEADGYGAADFGVGGPPDPTVAAEQTSPPAQDADLNLERLEQQAINTALKKHRYNISKAAKELGITRASLYRRMEKHGL